MTPEELMKPRIKIIAHWPNMEDDFDSVVGEVIELPSDKWIYSDNEHCEENYFNDWPHLFQPLPWYAERKPEDMPEYLKSDMSDKNWVGLEVTVKVSSYYGNDNEFVEIDGRADDIQWCTDWFIPATITDYEQYINSKQQP